MLLFYFLIAWWCLTMKGWQLSNFSNKEPYGGFRSNLACFRTYLKYFKYCKSKKVIKIQLSLYYQILIWLSPNRTKKWSFPLRISSVNVTKSAWNCGFGHIYWRNSQWKTSFFVQCHGRMLNNTHLKIIWINYKRTILTHCVLTL